MARIFLSYAREDIDTARQLADAVGDAGHDVWWDRHLHGGSRFSTEIDRELKDAQVVVSSYEIAPGAVLPVHKHPFPRYAYVQAGHLRVTNNDTRTGFTDYHFGYASAASVALFLLSIIATVVQFAVNRKGEA